MTAQLQTFDLDPTLGAPVLDNAAWESLNGVHSRFAIRIGQAARYQPEVAGFVAIADGTDEKSWHDLAQLIGPGATVHLSGDDLRPPVGWTSAVGGQGVQLINVSLDTRVDPEAVELGAADVPEILDLVARTKPGPFAPRTIELGRYLGIRSEGKLVALAGERLQPPGWTEISAVCTDPDFRGRGLATRLVRSVAAGIIARGDRALLHAVSTNSNAIRLYESIGFRARRVNTFSAFTSPS
ncbi:GNAT family N-acetyltransferase [Nakamurella silvestris]|nr:GNAT family N-acetyltransferase [Nakamurella silvestris]